MVPPSAPFQWGQGNLFEPCSGARIALRRKSHHPLLAVLAEAPFVLHAWLRSGNTSSGRGVCAFLKEALDTARGGVHLRSRAGAHRMQNRARAVANRGWSREAQNLDRQGLLASRANCAAFAPKVPALPRLGHDGTRRLRDLTR